MCAYINSAFSAPVNTPGPQGLSRRNTGGRLGPPGHTRCKAHALCSPPPSGLTDAARRAARTNGSDQRHRVLWISGWGGVGSAGLCTFPFQLKSRFELKICRLASRAAVLTEEVLCSLTQWGRARRRKPRRYWIKSHGATHRANLGH